MLVTAAGLVAGMFTATSGCAAGHQPKQPRERQSARRERQRVVRMRNRWGRRWGRRWPVKNRTGKS
ncbi:hypothetical protein ALI144C_13035 [Actinosynnema sp. ALI-1.44]|nr:hypothetical protein ALI144C_13035 [Actinosynnema sp. ALI-1.44]